VTKDLDGSAIFAKGPVVVFKWRNSPGWPVEYASPNVVEVFGFTTEEFVSGAVSYGSLVHGEDAARVASEVAAAARDGVDSFVHEPYRVIAKDGAVRWLYDATHVVRDAGGEVTHFHGYVIDVSARVRAEEAERELERRLYHAQKLESLGVLAGGVAHDFNNLLTAILGQAELARRRLERAPETALGSIEQIEGLTRRAADLTRQLLAYSGKGSFVVEPVAIEALVAEMSGMLEIVVPKKAELQVDIQGPLPAVMADRAQLQQVVMNLLTNAAEALPEGEGKISLVVRALDLDRPELDERGASDLSPGPYLEVTVSDTGVGMADDVRDRLFDPFFTTKASGRGLGMSAVLGILRGHGGHVDVRSAVGQGTTFTLLLPATSRPPSSKPTGRGTIRARRGRLLLVDDEPHIRTTLSTLLQHFGFEVVTAEDGKRAVELFDELGGDVVLVLMDMTMPVMSGPEALRELRRRDPKLPVILSSGFSETEVSRAAGADGVSGFLAKPYDLEDLRLAIDAVLEPLERR
jgi:PAS domain S-box-containing protein